MNMVKNINAFGLVLMLSVAALLTACASVGNSSSSVGEVSNSFEQHVNLARQYIVRGNRDLARMHLVKAEQVVLGRSEISQLNGAHALLYQTESEFALAEEYYLKAVKSDPQDSALRYNFATFLLARGRAQESIVQMSVACDDFNYHRRPQGFFMMGLAHNMMSNPDKALVAFDKAIQLKPDFAPSYLEVSKIYFDQQDYQRARAELDAYTVRAGDTAQGLWQLIKLNLATNDIRSMQEAGASLKSGFPRSKQATEFEQLIKQMENADNSHGDRE